VARNWRCSRGELDLVLVSPANEVVFAEVKTTCGLPEAAWSRIDPAKEGRLAAAAGAYLAAHGLAADHPHRFDVVIVLGDPRVLRRPLRFVWHRGVF
jgi:putative endonuclease